MFEHTDRPTWPRDTFVPPPPASIRDRGQRMLVRRRALMAAGGLTAVALAATTAVAVTRDAEGPSRTPAALATPSPTPVPTGVECSVVPSEWPQALGAQRFPRSETLVDRTGEGNLVVLYNERQTPPLRAEIRVYGREGTTQRKVLVAEKNTIATAARVGDHIVWVSETGEGRDNVVSLAPLDGSAPVQELGRTAQGLGVSGGKVAWLQTSPGANPAVIVVHTATGERSRIEVDHDANVQFTGDAVFIRGRATAGDGKKLTGTTQRLLRWTTGEELKMPEGIERRQALTSADGVFLFPVNGKLQRWTPGAGVEHVVTPVPVVTISAASDGFVWFSVAERGGEAYILDLTTGNTVSATAIGKAGGTGASVGMSSDAWSHGFTDSGTPLSELPRIRC